MTAASTTTTATAPAPSGTTRPPATTAPRADHHETPDHHHVSPGHDRSRPPRPPPAPPPPGGQIPLDQLPRGFVGSKRILIQSSPQQGYEDGDQGNFRNYCDFSHMNYDDPIVYPGQPGAAHLHSFFGNTGVNARTTTGSLRTSGNGTCWGASPTGPPTGCPACSTATAGPSSRPCR